MLHATLFFVINTPIHLRFRKLESQAWHATSTEHVTFYYCAPFILERDGQLHSVGVNIIAHPLAPRVLLRPPPGLKNILSFENLFSPSEGVVYKPLVSKFFWANMPIINVIHDLFLKIQLF